MPPITDAFSEQGPHELTICSLFPQAFAWTGSSPVFSKPLYILAFTNRSGSNSLADYLRQTGKFRGFGEGLNGDEVERNVRRDPTINSFPDYIARLAGARNEPGFWGSRRRGTRSSCCAARISPPCSPGSGSFIPCAQTCSDKRCHIGSPIRRING